LLEGLLSAEFARAVLATQDPQALNTITFKNIKTLKKNGKSQIVTQKNPSDKDQNTAQQILR
jgi:hypothetical protein